MPNRLIHETSPYLLQHATNPVDWHPWGEEALNLAREQNKPILLSIGYSACHWCHVMAHESFEDEEIAALMNEHFINIKVDREERPDLDHIYQSAHAMLTGRHGGWPLTMFLTPEQIPFFGGTYFPKQPRYNLPGFADLLPRIAEFYRDKSDAIAQQGEEMSRSLSRDLPVAANDELNALPLSAAMRDLESSYDPQFGGFGGAPKFPHPADLNLCLREALRTGDDSLSRMALRTLEQMARGGIYDQLGGGFFRYSVDERWEIPHFEKMLYDNAQLLPLYADAWQLTRNPLFRHVVEETVEWLGREMQAADGGFYSTLDADSEHEEGKFYIWTSQQIRDALTAQQYAVCTEYFGLGNPPNFEHHWHLRATITLPEAARKLDLGEAQCGELLAQARAGLFTLREQRIRPGRDEKILTSWNALMISGLAHAARIFSRDDWLQSARRAKGFIGDRLWHDGTLLACFKDGRARFNAYLDDYAFLLDALLELMQAEFDPSDLAWSHKLADIMLTRFRDERLGDFFFTSDNHETLLHRPKPMHDNAMPNGMAIAVRSLQRLGCLTGEQRYLAAAEQVLMHYHATMCEYPGGFATLQTALQEYVTPLNLLVLRGKKDDLAPWLSALDNIYRPGLFCVAIPTGVAGLPETLDRPCADVVSAWLCQGTQCLPPIYRLDDLMKNLNNNVNVC